MLTPQAVIGRIRERFGGVSTYALGNDNSTPWSYNQLRRWERTTPAKDGPNFWHTVELLQLAGLLNSAAVPSEPRLPTDPAVLLQQLEDALAAAIPALREALQPQEPGSQADGAR